jgi:hypothetical protein
LTTHVGIYGIYPALLRLVVLSGPLVVRGPSGAEVGGRLHAEAAVRVEQLLAHLGAEAPPVAALHPVVAVVLGSVIIFTSLPFWGQT